MVSLYSAIKMMHGPLNICVLFVFDSVSSLFVFFYIFAVRWFLHVDILSSIVLNILFDWLVTTLCSTLSIIRKIYEYLFLLDVCLEILFIPGYA